MMPYKKTNKPLTTLISARHRLTDEQRMILRDAYNKLRSGKAPKPTESLSVGSNITVETHIDYMSDWYARLGMSSIVVADILGSRDSISINILLKIQEALGVEVITKKTILDAAKSYVDFVWAKDIVEG